MYDLSQPNTEPGLCAKCKGTGTYSWGASVNGRSSKSGTCFSCAGTGKQTTRDIKRNRTYNKYKVARIVSSDFVRDPGEDAADRWNETHGDRY